MNYVTAVCVNWGRGYDPGEFKRNVMNVLEFTDGRDHVVLLPQEVDEADPAPEHKVFGSMLEKHSKRVGWNTHEPIVLSPPFRVRRPRVRVTMGSGVEIGAPNTGPTRHAVTCVGAFEDIELGFGNTHPHRNIASHVVQEARRRGERVFSHELTALYRSRGGTSVIWGADTNDQNFPEMIANEQTAIVRGLDTIRYKEHPHGANLVLLNVGTLQGSIDPHDPLWARFRVDAR